MTILSLYQSIFAYNAVLVLDKSYSFTCQWYSDVSLHRPPVSDLLCSFSPCSPWSLPPSIIHGLGSSFRFVQPPSLKTGPTACPDLSLQVSGLWNEFTTVDPVPGGPRVSSGPPSRSLHTHNAVHPDSPSVSLGMGLCLRSWPLRLNHYTPPIPCQLFHLTGWRCRPLRGLMRLLGSESA